MSCIDVSVIIPVWNCSSTIEESLKSVFSQVNIELELIVIDAHSNDGTHELVKGYLRQQDQYELQKDTGLYAAINRGILLASGKWIYIMGGDDRLYHENVLSMFTSNASVESDLIFGDVVYHDNSSVWVKNRHVSSFGAGLIWRNTLHQQSVLYRREIFENHEFNRGFKILSDYALHLSLYFDRNKKTVNGAYIPEIVASCGAKGLSKRFNFSLYLEELRVRKFAMPFWIYFATTPWVLVKFLLKGGLSGGKAINHVVK